MTTGTANEVLEAAIAEALAEVFSGPLPDIKVAWDKKRKSYVTAVSISVHVQIMNAIKKRLAGHEVSGGGHEEVVVRVRS